jgi:hypothetical protein
MTNQTAAEIYATRLTTLQAITKKLEAMVELLYPYDDEGSPELIWLRDIQSRYPLTQLGSPARQALTQAQRINRTQRQHWQLGLCEFQIGLIFLHYQADCHYAVTQFGAARRQWQFVNEMAAVCLTHYAQGLVHYHEQEYEAALRQYSQAEQLLPRLQFNSNNSNQKIEKFMEDLITALTAAKKKLLEEMWPADTTPAPAPTPEPVPPPATGAAAAADTHTPDADQGRQVDQAASIQRPVDRMNTATPLPDHLLRGHRYIWYQVVQRYDLFLQEITQGTWLLVDTEPAAAAQKPGTPVIVVNNPENIHASVAVSPYETSGVGQRISYVGCVVGREPPIEHEVRFSVDPASKNVTLQLNSQQQLEIQESNIAGVVIGIWQPEVTFRQS